MKRRTLDKELARKMRVEGKTYSEIKARLNVSKSSLSLWLRDMQLSREQMRMVRDLSPKRIENFRLTMQKKRDARLESVYTKVQKDIGSLNQREIFLAGLFLYWGGRRQNYPRISYGI